MMTPEHRLDALEELVIDEFARIWNSWSRTGRFNHQEFESWKDNMHHELRKKQAGVRMRQSLQGEPPEYA